MTFNVTQEHIDNGVKRACMGCPVARAIAEKFPTSVVLVRTHDVEIRHFRLGDEGIVEDRISLPQHVVNWILDFDNGRYDRTTPFSFILDIQ